MAIASLALGNWFAIYKRELQSYFKAPLAYIIAGVFWLIAGIFFIMIMSSVLGQSGQLDFQQQQTGGQPINFDAPYVLLQQFLGTLASLVLVLMPMLSMGLYAEERKRGTLELLATSPITNWSVAVGKLAAVVTFFVGMMLPMMAYEAVILSATSPGVAPTVFLLSHLGLVLLASAILSLGMFVSSLTSSTIVAAIMTFALVLLLWIVDALGSGASGTIAAIANHLSMIRHYTQLTQGIIDTSGLMMLASYTFLGIFLTAQSIETFRFQRS